jgi:arginine N-succinyltransferase
MKEPGDYLLRPVRETDAEALFHLVGTIGHGLTSLPNDPDFLTHRIDDSLRAFDPRVRKPGGEIYLFVLEDCATGELVGTSGILSRVGGFDPFYTYRIREHVQEYPPLNIRRHLKSLHLTRSHKGPTELCSLFLQREHRTGGLGKLLSLSRFTFMQAFPERFDTEIIAELRGYIDADNRSPFWEAVGVKFFEKDYYTADILSGVGEKDFIEALMPKFPIYISLLPESARSVIGEVHPHTEAARRILLGEGFQQTNEVDIFDAGPILKARRDQLRTWKAARTGMVAEGNPDGPDRQTAIVSNESLDFRSLITGIVPGGGDAITLSSDAVGRLRLKPGDRVRYVLLET